MPFKSNSTFDSLLAMTALCNDAELRALADKCQNLIADRERIKREELRQELMANLKNTISDILRNDFTLVLTNKELNPEEDECYGVCFNPEDIHSIKINMIDTK